MLGPRYSYGEPKLHGVRNSDADVDHDSHGQRHMDSFGNAFIDGDANLDLDAYVESQCYGDIDPNADLDPERHLQPKRHIQPKPYP